MAMLRSPTTPGGAFDWILISIGLLLLATSAVFYYVGYF